MTRSTHHVVTEDTARAIVVRHLVPMPSVKAERDGESLLVARSPCYPTSIEKGALPSMSCRRCRRCRGGGHGSTDHMTHRPTASICSSSFPSDRLLVPTRLRCLLLVRFGRHLVTSAAFKQTRRSKPTDYYSILCGIVVSTIQTSFVLPSPAGPVARFTRSTLKPVSHAASSRCADCICACSIICLSIPL
jgi:hypothetical protein